MQSMLTFDTLLSIGIGLGLAAAAGFRVFVPLLMLGVAARTGHVPLSAGFEWIASTPALVAFATATLVEIGAYYLPWLDNLLDTISMPAAVTAGVIASASVMTDVSPLLRWSVAIIGGGAAAGAVAGSTSLLRLKSTATTAGAGNFLVATMELLGSVLTSILAIVWPILTLVVVLLILYVVFRLSRRLVRGHARVPAQSRT